MFRPEAIGRNQRVGASRQRQMAGGLAPRFRRAENIAAAVAIEDRRAMAVLGRISP